MLSHYSPHYHTPVFMLRKINFPMTSCGGVLHEELESAAWYSPAWSIGRNTDVSTNVGFKKKTKKHTDARHNLFSQVSQTEYHPTFVWKDTLESVSTHHTRLSSSQKRFNRRLVKLLLFQDAGRPVSPSRVHRCCFCCRCRPCCIWFRGSAHTVLWFGPSHCHFTGISCHLHSVKVSHRSTPACKC